MEVEKSINVLSLFDGISCGMVALDRLGVKVSKYDAYEIDKDAIKVSKSNYPQINQCGDVFNAKYKPNSYDLLIGGSPCTHWSIAKAGNKGVKGSRETTASGIGWELFMQYVRALREVKPKWFMYENNASMSNEIKECITKELCVEPVLIDSADFSAQHRKRLYWTNIPLNDKPKPNTDTFANVFEKSLPHKTRSFEKYKDTVRISKDGLSVSWDTSGKGYYSQANRAKKINQKWNTVTAAVSNDKNNIWAGKYEAWLCLPIELERLQTLPDNYTEVLKNDGKRNKAIGNGWTVDVIAYLLSNIRDVKDI